MPATLGLPYSVRRSAGNNKIPGLLSKRSTRLGGRSRCLPNPPLTPTWRRWTAKMALQHVAGFATGQSLSTSVKLGLITGAHTVEENVDGAEEKLARTARWQRGLQPSSVQTPSASLYAEEQRLLFYQAEPKSRFSEILVMPTRTQIFWHAYHGFAHPPSSAEPHLDYPKLCHQCKGLSSTSKDGVNK